MPLQFSAEWGTVIVLVNGDPTPFEVRNLPCCTKRFRVNGRVRLSCSIPEIVNEKGTSIKCQIRFHDGIYAPPCEETGEELALVSYYWDNYKLSIGTLGDRKDTRYNYTNDGLEMITTSSPSHVAFYIAWIEWNGDKQERERQDIFPWFAADPACDTGRSDW